MKLEDFNYSLPKNLIAVRPAVKKKSKLLVCKKNTIVDFKQILNEINNNDILIFNNTKVIPSIINGECNKKKIKLTLLENYKNYFWKVFIKPSKKVKHNEIIKFKNNLQCKIENKETVIADVKFNLSYKKVISYLDKFGDLPLPPYVKSESNRKLDEKFYQTVFAKNIGAVASPTAGLHFDQVLIDKIKKKNINIIFTTLHVGMGTFLPLKENKVIANKLHQERGVITQDAAKKINKALSENKKIIAVGTTVVRLLEDCYSKYGKIRDFDEDINLFIYPGFKFNVVDKLLTNFHLPKSSLFILVSAFAGRKKLLDKYNMAIKNKMKFFSFGDAMLIDKNNV